MFYLGSDGVEAGEIPRGEYSIEEHETESIGIDSGFMAIKQQRPIFEVPR